MEKNTLNGFEAIVDSLLPNFSTTKTDNIDTNDAAEELTDEELKQIRKQSTVDTKDNEDKEDKDEDKKSVNEDEDDELKQDDKRRSSSKRSNVNDNTDDDTEDDASDDTDTDSEATAIIGFFDAISEKLGWDDVEEDEKPKTAEELVEYFREVIEDNSKPNYASEEVEQLDNFVRNGGNLKDYFQIDADLDLDNINLEDDEVMQKAVVRSLLKEKGFSTTRIDKMIAKYEDAGILEDEATDALEDLKEINKTKKEQLLEKQQKYAAQVKQQQQEFFDNVMNEIKGLDNIYGIAVPEKDKRALLEYIFKPNSKGITKYQEDYAKSLKNLVTSAYFTMKGDSIISIAEKKGKKDAIDNFKNTLTKNTGVNKRSKRIIENNDNDSIWSTFTRQLRA